MIQSYSEFLQSLLEAGFSFAYGGNDQGLFSLLKYDWTNEPPESALKWFSCDPELDPCCWRMRLLDERDDISYAKVFFKKAGYITKEWAPYFLAARRPKPFDEAYADGLITHYAKTVYDYLRENGPTPADRLKFSKEEKKQYERAAEELQMGLYITLCGQDIKISRKGDEYGWASNVFCTLEEFWPEEVFAQAAAISQEEAEEKITQRLLSINPESNPKKIRKFIYGK